MLQQNQLQNYHNNQIAHDYGMEFPMDQIQQEYIS
jgi:hypothetical protein